MEKSKPTKEQSKPTPSMDALMHMGIYIPADVKPEALTEKGKEVAGIKKDQ
jgi:hypothetical protein